MRLKKAINTLTHDTRLNLFSNLAKSFLIKLPKPPDKYNLKSVIQYYSTFAITAGFCLIGTTGKQIFKIIQDIKSSKAAGVDKLSGRFIKDGADIIAKSNACKVAKLKPLNNRPISFLPVISKIIEKVVHDQRNPFLSDKNLLYKYQSGFRANYLINLCFSFLTDKILKGFEEGLLTGMILINLQKTFDTIDHEILLQKRKAIRFSKGTLQWF